MWSVLRRLQGEELESTPSQTKGHVRSVTAAHGGHHVGPITEAQAARLDAFSINQRAIARHSCLGDPAPDAPDSLTVPYGNWVYSKLLKNATHDNVILRRKAYGMLLELFAQKSEHALSTLDAGAMDIMVGSLKDGDEEVRGLACMALQVAVHCPKGQQLAIGGGHLKAFLDAVGDDSVDVVAEALRLCAFCHMTQNEGAATAALIRFKCIPIYVAKISSPNDDVAAMALAALGRVFDIKEAFIIVNDNHALKPTVKLLKTRQDAGVLVEACELVSKVAFYSAGKRAAVQEHVVEAILPLATHEDPIVRTAATGALVALTISEDGKQQAIAAGIVDRLHTLVLQEEERDVLANAVKTVCNVSEHPVARQQLSIIVTRLQQVSAMAEAESHTSLKVSVDRAIAMINWQPGDAY